MPATAAEFLNLLPQFEMVELGTIETWLAEAAATVPTTGWGADEDRGQIYLTAHMMSLAGIGPERASAALVGLKSLSSGSLSFTKEDRGRMGDYALTSFGRFFWPILNSYGQGIFVTGTGYLPEDANGHWPGVPGYAA